MAGETTTPETVAVLKAAVDADNERARHDEPLTPGEWIRRNLFNSVLNSVITVVLAVVTAVVAYRLARFVFVTGRWEPIRVNLELFMIGLYPRDERWRIVAQLVLAAAAIGTAVGCLRAGAEDRARETGEPFVPDGWRDHLATYWSVVLFLVVLLVAFTDTVGPWLVTAGAAAAAVTGYASARMLPTRLRLAGWTLAALLAVVELQMLTGTGGLAWLFTTAALIPLLNRMIGAMVADAPAAVPWALAGAGGAVGVATLVVRPDPLGLLAVAVGGAAVVSVLRGDRVDGARIGAVVLVGLALNRAYAAIGMSGIDWEFWNGLHLTLMATVIAIILAFPLGLVLALGRRSKMPAIRLVSVTYIEFFRGAPLITFLLVAQFFLGFFLDTETPLSLTTRAIAAVTLFTAAYVAEIVRGGLQAVPSGQVEAGQALGLSAARITRLIVLPQALRAVIPAMVGQFISLFKDTSLFVIITLTEFLAVREIVHAQAEFRGFGIGESLVFVAFGYWAFAFAMSRESQRLERRLGVGER